MVVAVYTPTFSSAPPLKLLDQIRDHVRRQCFPNWTEIANVSWVTRYIRSISIRHLDV